MGLKDIFLFSTDNSSGLQLVCQQADPLQEKHCKIPRGSEHVRGEGGGGCHQPGQLPGPHDVPGLPVVLLQRRGFVWRILVQYHNTTPTVVVTWSAAAFAQSKQNHQRLFYSLQIHPTSLFSVFLFGNPGFQIFFISNECSFDSCKNRAL